MDKNLDDFWLTQKKGWIDHYLPEKDRGNQPIRVLHKMILYMFIHHKGKFHLKLIDAALFSGMHPEVEILHGDLPLKEPFGKFRTPRVDSNKKLTLHETFLSYTWIMTYSIYILYIETIDYPRVNKLNRRIVKKISIEEINKAKELFNYGKLLIVDYVEWDKDTLPNPERYLAEKRDYPEQTNLYFTEAIRFILCHEFIHITHHIDKLKQNNYTDSEILKMEKEADDKAIDLIIGDMKKGREFIYEGGIIIGILTMFFLRKNTKQKKHPDLDDRLLNAINKLKLSDNHMAWGMSCIGLKLWDEQFDFRFEWDNESQSFKEQFYKIIAQIKKRK